MLGRGGLDGRARAGVRFFITACRHCCPACKSGPLFSATVVTFFLPGAQQCCGPSSRCNCFCLTSSTSFDGVTRFSGSTCVSANKADMPAGCCFVTSAAAHSAHFHRCCFAMFPPPETAQQETHVTAVFPCVSPSMPRRKKDGDRFRPTWRDRPAKLKDFLRGQGVPLHRREEVALICDQDDVVSAGCVHDVTSCLVWFLGGCRCSHG